MNLPPSVRAITALLFTSLALTASTTTAADKCIYGDCRNGFGILRVEKDQGGGFGSPTYFVGTFKKGKLEGDGYQIFFGDGNGKEEVKLLQIAIAGKLDRVKSLNGELIYVGQFVHGVRQGKGALRYDRSGTGYGSTFFQEISQGNFVNGQLTGPGILQRSTNRYDTLGNPVTYSGEFKEGKLVSGLATVTLGDQTGVIAGPDIDARRLNGWFTLNFTTTHAGTTIEPEPFRLLFIDGYRIEDSRNRATTLRQARVQLPDRTYEGEVDETGQPSGFGRLWWSESGNTYSYEGDVVNGRPNGYGHMQWAWNVFPTAMGGRWVNGEMVDGVLVHHGVSSIELTWGSFDAETGTNGRFSRLGSGAFTDGRAIELTYDTKDGAHAQRRRVEGTYRNGRKTGVFVTSTSAGSATRETFADGESTGFSGQKVFSELRVGDVVCINDLISPVEDITLNVVTLLDGRTATFYTGQKVEISDVPPSRFYHPCAECGGKRYVEEWYQPPEEQVQVTTYTRTQINGDFTVFVTYVPHTETVTRRSPAFRRTVACRTCDGDGRLVGVRQVRKGE